MSNILITKRIKITYELIKQQKGEKLESIIEYYDHRAY